MLKRINRVFATNTKSFVCTPLHVNIICYDNTYNIVYTLTRKFKTYANGLRINFNKS